MSELGGSVRAIFAFTSERDEIGLTSFNVNMLSRAETYPLRVLHERGVGEA